MPKFDEKEQQEIAKKISDAMHEMALCSDVEIWMVLNRVVGDLKLGNDVRQARLVAVMMAHLEAGITSQADLYSNSLAIIRKTPKA